MLIGGARHEAAAARMREGEALLQQERFAEARALLASAIYTRPEIGWGLERMPEGISRTDEESVYAWDTGKGLVIEMVHVPAGPFRMGSDLPDEAPPCEDMRTEAFYVGRHETTWLEFQAFCEATGDTPPPAPAWGIHADNPVVNLTWDDAQSFCTWAGLSLPTEAQWEKAARGDDGRTFPWGDEAPTPDLCVFSRTETAPVGARAAGASPFGAQDMAGNVLEWCRDIYGAAEPSPPGRVCRGGSWRNTGPGVRAARRQGNDPGNGFAALGFRPVKEVDR